MPLLLAQTSEWLVVAKEPGWLTIPGRDPSKSPPVLLEWLREHHPEAMTVHRLDRETSGVILFARSPEAHRKANGWFSSHETRKFYDALAEGELTSPMLRINAPIAGSASLSQVDRKEVYPGCFLARVRIVTGRRHQVRIHLAGEGHPILGDLEYGGRRNLEEEGAVPLAFGRVALHAARLELPSGEVFEAPWPLDFASWVDELRRRSSRSPVKSEKSEKSR